MMADGAKGEPLTNHATRMFRWHDQIAADPEAKRQALALLVTNFIREKMRATKSSVEFNQGWLAGELGVSIKGLKKAIGWLRRRGHLIVHVRKHLRLPNLYEPVVKAIGTPVPIEFQIDDRGSGAAPVAYERALGREPQFLVDRTPGPKTPRIRELQYLRNQSHLKIQAKRRFRVALLSAFRGTKTSAYDTSGATRRSSAG